MNDIQKFIYNLSNETMTNKQAVQYFSSMPVVEQISSLRLISLVTYQNKPQLFEELKTQTGCGLNEDNKVLRCYKKLGFNQFRHQLDKMPQKYYLEAFIIFLSIFQITDKRCKHSLCANGCNHWWHQKSKIDDVEEYKRSFIKQFEESN